MRRAEELDDGEQQAVAHSTAMGLQIIGVASCIVPGCPLYSRFDI